MRSPFTITRLDRYVFGQLALGLAVTTVGLVALIWLTQSLRFIQLIIQRGLSPFVFVHLTGLLLPSFVAVILPITCFIVTMFVYTRLISDRELVVMRASGMSDPVIARPAIALATLSMVLCFILNVWVVPASLHQFSKFEFQIRNKVAAFLLEPGVFTPIPGHITVYIQSRDQNSVLHGILIEDQRQKGAPATILARTGRLVAGPNGPEVLLRDGSREQIDPKTGRLNVLSFKRNLIDLAQSSSETDSATPKTSEATIWQLFHPNPAQIPPATRLKWHAEAWRRLVAPLDVMSYTLIALLAVLRSPFRRQANNAALAAAVVGVMVLVALGIGVDSLAARQNGLIPLIFIVAAGPALVCGVLIARVERLTRAQAA
ncbi:MAG: LPS export ABC transporter permease LptF [Acidiphilium sp. 37-64-53]|uniref:LPS export ABC transporter permease LptF n=1 Tax=Acidiphilium TaxID=522 RepID=UPI000BC9A721|nr:MULTISPECIES: LPS export ABC transporter permease LptF [Acidiphilium]OYW00890.1 MAG: LPS export ABC transporter permease LptF [Acidiphilium sp. 37-64-53]OZB27458.1 MAG: LPS export ABC transporter permease LptF [Acidiphilium sp. 34-64-41]HQT86321.1 LPS export ABC transporter permease LptF [Acidiphilium rubrum]